MQYKEDCERLFGRILDNKNVKSSLQVRPKSNDYMAQWWNKLFPLEPFELDLTTDDTSPACKYDDDVNGITYDLVAAVQRQSSFYPHVMKISPFIYMFNSSFVCFFSLQVIVNKLI